MSPQLAEAWDRDDDWTGITSAKERRKRQNRIHQRAYRKKNHLKKIPAEATKSKDEQVAGSATMVCTMLEQSAASRRYQSELFIAVLDRLPMIATIKDSKLQDGVKTFLRQAFTNWGLNLPTTRDLHFVTRLTTFDALVRNAMILGIPLEQLETEGNNSPFHFQGPQLPDDQRKLPPPLRPSLLQKRNPHHCWVDLFPIPILRDNILLAVARGESDEDQLCNALCHDLFDFESDTKASVLVWGESWDDGGWEFTPRFLQKWGTLMQRCPEILQTANHLRESRGKSSLE